MNKKHPGPRLDSLRVRHFELLRQLAELGSMRRAAEALHVSQPAASAMLKEAEARLGTVLFRRDRRGVVPTPEAEAVLRRVRILLKEVEGLGEELGDARRQRPLVRIGSVPHALLWLVQDLSAHWAARAGVRLRLDDGPTSALAAMLVRGDVDAIVAPLAPESGQAFTSAVRCRRLYDETIVVAASARNPMAKARRVSLEALETADWVLPGPTSRSRQALEGEFLRLGLAPPRPSVEVTSFVYGLALVARTTMLTVAPATAVRAAEVAGGVRRLSTPLAFPPYAVNWITRRDSGARALLDEMGDWLVKRAAEGMPGRR